MKTIICQPLYKEHTSIILHCPPSNIPYILPLHRAELGNMDQKKVLSSLQNVFFMICYNNKKTKHFHYKLLGFNDRCVMRDVTECWPPLTPIPCTIKQVSNWHWNKQFMDFSCNYSAVFDLNNPMLVHKSKSIFRKYNC